MSITRCLNTPPAYDIVKIPAWVSSTQHAWQFTLPFLNEDDAVLETSHKELVQQVVIAVIQSWFE